MSVNQAVHLKSPKESVGSIVSDYVLENGSDDFLNYYDRTNLLNGWSDVQTDFDGKTVRLSGHAADSSARETATKLAKAALEVHHLSYPIKNTMEVRTPLSK